MIKLSAMIVMVTGTLFCHSLSALEKPAAVPAGPLKSVSALCAPATASADLDINNVRATILNGGDLWWDLVDGGYFIPKPAPGMPGTTSIFAGGLWIGGIDAAGTVKLSAMTYRQTGNDFWPGPLDPTASIDAATCLAWDKIFKINKQDVSNYINWFDQGSVGTNPVSAAAMDVIVNWPTLGPSGQAMAPYYDRNGNGSYDPAAGDYPDFWLGGNSRPAGQTECDVRMRGDQVLYWVFNDKGNVSGETGGPGIGLEIHAQAFAYKTNDEINDMTFYHYTFVNRSSFRLDSTYAAMNVDTDIGSASDDYVGCDVTLGLGYSYNGDMVDDNPPAGQIPYGANPPAIGLDFFEGPYADPNGIDDAYTSKAPSYQHYGDGIADNERIGMTKFIYHNNDATVMGYPSGDLACYCRLKGRWSDGSSFTYGGVGHLTGVACDYFFPGTSDPEGFGTGGIPQSSWTEELVGNVPSDRRFISSVGPFTLQPGGKNDMTTGLVWGRAHAGGNLASVTVMKGADAKAQEMFDNCFRTMMDGPDAPALAVQELENQVILSWTNPSTSNNYKENYSEDYNSSTGGDSLYRFQGYMVYQLKNENVTSAELYDVDKARLVFQCDKTDGVTQIINYKNDLELQALLPQEMVNGTDKGIFHSVSVTEDKFAIGNTQLVNHKTYYYAIIAYGYSPTLKDPDFNIPKDYLPFITGKLWADGYFVHSAIPHNPAPEAYGTSANSTYGMGPKLIRIEGHGNGGNVLDLTSSSISEILSAPAYRALHPVYENSHGPVNIKVIDPLNIPVNNDFEFKLTGLSSFAGWELINLSTGDTVRSDKDISQGNEQIINGQTGDSSTVIPKWGISVNVVYTVEPATANAARNGFLEATMTFSDVTKQWLSGMPDEEGITDANWIRSGNTTYPVPDNIYDDAIDPGTNDDLSQDYENILGKTWAPYRLCAKGTTATTITPATVYCKAAPAWPTSINLNKMSNLASVNVVICPGTPSLWTRCPVLEEQDDISLAAGGAKKLNLRKSPSVGKNGTAVFGTADNNDFPTGMSWFPGYAINIETGERLNMAFGEDSWLIAENGNDMMWNPTSTKYAVTGDPVFGGKHYVYVFGHNGDALFSATDPYLPGAYRDVPRYDQGKVLHDLLQAHETSGIDQYKREMFNDAMWVNIPLLAPGHARFETDVTVRIRVAKAYQKGYTTATPSADTSIAAQNNNLPMYTFNTAEIETHVNDQEVALGSLDLINIVPNPYYSYSSYEKKAQESIVKITNLPEKCDVSIYTLNGTLIRKYKKEGGGTSLNWDLKNESMGRIASGLYIIHIRVPDVGEKTLKWFGVMRPFDPESY